MKKLYTIFITIILSLSVINITYSESEYVNMKEEWTVRYLTNYSSEDNKVRIARFTNLKTNKDGFCIEPYVEYSPNIYKYTKNNSIDNNIYEIVRKYETYSDLSDESYIATQLEIWEYLTGITFTFNGLTKNDYLADNFFIKDFDYNISNIEKDIDLNNEYIEEDISLDEYKIIDTNVEILNDSNNYLKYNITDSNIEYGYIKLIKDNNPSKYTYASKNSQNIYTYSDGYVEDEILNIKLNINPLLTSIYFEKFDEDNHYLTGSEFSAYILDENSDENLLFIQNDVDINLKEVLIDDIDKNNYKIELSERYNQYLNNDILHTKEIGYFPYKIYKNNNLVKEGRAYVTNDTNLTDGIYKITNYKKINSSLSINGISSISNIPYNKEILLCESEPAKGYQYYSEPCKLISTDVNHKDDVHKFINSNRTFTLKLIKENSNHNIALDGAKFKISYIEDDSIQEVYFTTGALNISNPDNYKYLHYSYLNNKYTTDINNNDYIQNNMEPGIYYFYLSDDEVFDDSLIDNYTYVVDGGYSIDNIPYSSLITVEELEAPKGYYINDPKYTIMADIAYSEITFKNYRVNDSIIIPSVRKPVKTCIGD